MEKIVIYGNGQADKRKVDLENHHHDWQALPRDWLHSACKDNLGEGRARAAEKEEEEQKRGRGEGGGGVGEGGGEQRLSPGKSALLSDGIPTATLKRDHGQD